MTELIIALSGLIPVSSLLTWIFARRKNIAEALQSEAEAQKSELDVVEKAIRIWREMSEELRSELKASTLVIEGLRAKVEELAVENQSLRLEVAKLRCTNTKIVKALEKITPLNFDKVVQELKDKLNNIEN